MSNASDAGALLYEPEGAWGENLSTFTAHRLPIINGFDVAGLSQDKIDPMRVSQYLQEGSPHILGVMGGTFKVQIFATGHGSAVTGAFAVDALETFLSYIFSGGGALGAGGTVTSSGAGMTATNTGTAAAPGVSAVNGIPAGALVRFGSIGDARGNGQAVAVASHAGSVATLLTALDANPNNGDIVYSGANLYLPETPTNSTVTSLRFAWVTANLIYEMHGCWPMGVQLKGTGASQRPYWEIDFGCSWWKLNNALSLPSAVASNQYNPAPIAGGSLFVNDVGSSARAAANKRVWTDFSITMKLGIVPLPGPGGFNAYQNIVGARRIPTDIRWKWTEWADATTLAPILESYFLGTTSKHALWTGSAVNGSSLAAYAPNLRIVGPRPVQKAANKINSVSIEAEANTGGTAGSELLLSATRFFYS